MDSKLVDRICRSAPCPFRRDEPLALRTTFRIGGSAALFAEPCSAADLLKLYHIVRTEQVSYFHLGLGSNILISDDGFNGIVIKSGGELNRIEQSKTILTAGPGARLLDLTASAALCGLSGIEALSGIPGSVGGGLYMNAGAYGMEISDTLIELDILTRDNRIETLCRDDIHFGYRSAPELQDAIVLESRYRLTVGDRASVFREMRRVWKLRRAKQPLEYPSAGSVFKRPPNDFAGRLIEAVGGKGLTIGGAMVSLKHAGFIVNMGNAKASDVCALVKEIRRRVYEKFHVLLEPEIKTVGFNGDPFEIAI